MFPIPVERLLGCSLARGDPFDVAVVAYEPLALAWIQNTFPSGHVAATAGAALSVFDVSPAAGAVFLWIALSIVVSVVVRRYHYFADAVLAVALALATWLVQ